MNTWSRRLLTWGLRRSHLALLPVRVRGGIAKGARWSLYPWTSYWRGTHEPAVQQRLIALWDWTGKVCWDLGAHYGLFAVGLGRRVGPTGAVAAFEPNPASYERLQLHVRRNHLTWVQTFPMAVSDKAGRERFLDYDNFTGTAAHLMHQGETWHAGIPTISVEICRLDDLVAAGRIRAPDFIKLDVEGHGHHALAGARASVSRTRPVIMAGMHSRQEAEGILALLEPLGYTRDAIDGAAADSPENMLGRDFLFTPTERASSPGA